MEEQNILLLLTPASGLADAFLRQNIFADFVKSNANIVESSPESSLNGNFQIHLVIVFTIRFLCSGTFDLVISNNASLSTEVLGKLLEHLKSGCCLLIQTTEQAELCFSLKISGYIVENCKPELIVARKPEHSIGSAVKIDFSGEKTKKVWSLDDIDNPEDFINDEELLDEEDKVKPSAESLKVCSTTKLRKACANCSCGLAEELEQEEIQKIRDNSQNAKSSCGNVSEKQ